MPLRFKRVEQVHLRPLAWGGFGVLQPEPLWFTGAANEGTGATKSLYTLEAAGDKPSLCQISVEPFDSEAQLTMGAADDVQDVP